MSPSSSNFNFFNQSSTTETGLALLTINLKGFLHGSSFSKSIFVGPNG